MVQESPASRALRTAVLSWGVPAAVRVLELDEPAGIEFADRDTAIQRITETQRHRGKGATAQDPMPQILTGTKGPIKS